MKSLTPALAALTFFGPLSVQLQAQSVLIDWNKSWNYLHPTGGVLPAGSGTTTPHPDGTTPWFATAAQFNASYTGPSFTTSGAGFEAGAGPAPIGYGTINYVATPDPAPAEFSEVATDLTAPASGERFTAYFRTTFTVPNDGNFRVTPELRYILDDGGFVYLDGEVILRVNAAADAVDDYKTIALGTGNTESQIRTAELDLAVGSVTGANTTAAAPFGGNATVLKSIGRLTPGTHTLAVSVHNAGATSSDLVLAVQLRADVVDCVITGTAAASSRDFKGTPGDPTDDTISASVTVTPEGAVGANWIVSGPAGSAAIGRTGAYNTPVSLANLPIAEFASGSRDLTLADSTNATCITTVRVVPQRIIATNDLLGTNLPFTTLGKLDVPGWTFDDTARSLQMNAPGGNGSRYVVTSRSVDLTGQPDVQFSGTLTVTDTSSGNEIDDTFVAFLILNGNAAAPVNLISRHDLLTPDGILSGAELAAGAGTFTYTLEHVIPASVTSAQIVIEGINNSASEVFTVSGLKFAQAPPQLQAYPGPVVFNNQGTPNPADDTFSAGIFITPVNLGISTGWTSNATPAAGLYAAAKPVTFGPFAPFTSPRTITLADLIDSSKTAAVVLPLALPEIIVTGPTDVVRIENGPGFADDSVTFALNIAGTNGGPSWKTDATGLSPTSGVFGPVIFTIPAPLTPANLDFDIADVSYASITRTVTVPVPDRYPVGQSDLSGALLNVNTDLASNPNPRWISDPANRTLTLDTGSAELSVVRSETVNLTAAGEVFFSASLRATDSSGGSNFEAGDRFKAELVYNVAGVATTLNLVDPYDIGNGAATTTGTTMGANGAPNGFINGYGGAAGTNLTDGTTVYATGADDYNANRARDEFNAGREEASASLDNVFSLKATIPATADDVYLVITGQGIGGSERVVVSNVLFSTTDTQGDTDSDGIPDDYEIANGLNPFDAADRDLDPDRDGQSNFSEFLAGTAANDPDSLLRLTSYTRGNGRVSVAWTSVPGKIYRAQISTGLATWTDLGVDLPANAAPATMTTANSVLLPSPIPPRAFFRIRVKTE